MKKLFLVCILGLAACEEVPGGGFAAPASGGGAFKEYFVLGNNSMSYQDCVARGGLVIHDAGSSMWACDPRVTNHNNVSPDEEFNHPDT